MGNSQTKKCIQVIKNCTMQICNYLAQKQSLWNAVISYQDSSQLRMLILRNNKITDDNIDHLLRV